MRNEPDRLIRDLLYPRRVPTEDEINAILDHVAKAPFSARAVSVDRAIRAEVFHGKKLGAREPSIVAHLAKRVLVEQDWAEDVTAGEYLNHLRGVTADPDLRKVIYVRKDRRLFLGLLAPNRVPSERLGKNSSPFLWVVYSADYGTTVTGYQVRGVQEITLPEDARWL